MPFFHACIFAASTVTPVTVTPMVAAPWRAFSTKLAAAMSAFDGMQPQLRHTPPRLSFSMTSVLSLSCAQRIPAT